jgi:ABC-type sugar transport system substrate-binding protein
MRRISALVLAACAAAAAVPASASADTVKPAACNKVGIIYGYEGNNFTNVTFCGLGFYYRPSEGWQVDLVAPSTHNR